MKNEGTVKKSKLQQIPKNPIVVIGLGETGRSLLETLKKMHCHWHRY